VRLFALLTALCFVLGVGRPAWSCPSPPAKRCCCEPKQVDAASAATPRLLAHCPCELRPGPKHPTSTPPLGAAPGERDAGSLAPGAAPALVLPVPGVVDHAFQAYRQNHGPPLQTLLRLRTLFLC